MAVRVMIKRRVPREKEEELMKLVMNLRLLASQQPGYISGETLRNVDDLSNYLVISTWQTIDDWNAWNASQERSQVQKKIDDLLGAATQYDIYHYPEKKRIRLRDFIGTKGA